jgi:UDP-N-acetylmuramoyl-tripeptide--D-alanyl-D-alanine ligase
MSALYLSVLLVIGIFCFSRRSLRYLKYFQQQDYNEVRFLQWLREHRLYERRLSTLALVALLAALLCPRTLALVVGLLVAFGQLAISFLEQDPRLFGKIRLNMTERALRIQRVSLLMYSLLLLLLSLLCALLDPKLGSGTLALLWLLQILALQLVPLVIAAANQLLAPYEKAVQDYFLHQAKTRLAQVDPYVIGITGSYGKTSTKLLLGELLSVCVGPTFYPPKSYNSPMGITREIRERLRPGTRFAVIEMGAYAVGSIARLCALTPPKAAIITAVGVMHLERFGSEENVYRAKSELARALPEDGILVANGDNPGARRMAKEFPAAKTLLYGMDPSRGTLDVQLELQPQLDAETSAGSVLQHFKIVWGGKSYSGATRLLGKPALSNLLAAFTMASALGAEPEILLAAARNLEPADNRLSLRRAAGITWLQDAYNSNPTGFEAALEVLAAMPANRRILVTPGMIELGALQDSENQRLAALAAKICSVVIVVGETNRVAWQRGLAEGGLTEGGVQQAGPTGDAAQASAVRFIASRDLAFKELDSILSKGDVVLVENDLPDLYEELSRF